MKLKLEQRENWTKKWKITVSPSTKSIRIKIGTEVNSKLTKKLKRLSKSVYREWVKKRGETKTIRAEKPRKKYPVCFKTNDSKTVLKRRLGHAFDTYSIFRALLQGKKLYRVSKNETEYALFSLSSSKEQLIKRFSDKHIIVPENRLKAFWKVGKRE